MNRSSQIDESSTLRSTRSRKPSSEREASSCASRVYRVQVTQCHLFRGRARELRIVPQARQLNPRDRIRGLVVGARAAIVEISANFSWNPPAPCHLSWLDWSTPRAMSADGGWVVFEEGNDTTPDGHGI